jgi:parvulin-like peptidyl-prolyl isomerase
MTNNTNQGNKKPDQTPGRDKRKAAPGVPAANRPLKGATNPPKPASPTIKPATPAPANPPTAKVRPAQATTGGNRPQTQMSARALSRYERDLKRQRQLVWATIAVIALVVVVLAFGIWQTTLAPNFDVLASVNGQNISRADYNKFRKIDLFKQSGAIQQQLNYTSGDQQTQLQSQLSLLQDEANNISSRPVNQDALQRYVGNIVMEKAAKDQFNISVSDDEVSKYLGDQFQGIIYTPTPDATQALQTATAGPVATQEAQYNTATAAAVTPLPTATPSVSPSVSATTSVSSTTTTPGLTPGATTTPGLTTTVSGTVTVSATATITPTATATSTPIAANAVQGTAAAYQSDYLKSFRSYTGLSDDDYKKLEARPTLIKKKVVDKLAESQPKIGDPYPSEKLSHILVADEATAQDIYNQLKATPADQLNAKFVELARSKSTDTGSAEHNGDLGWSTDKTAYDKDFLAAALKLNKGEISQPVKTQFGYHIIWCTDKDDKRPLDATTIQGFQQTDANGDPQYFADWLKGKVDAAKPTYNTPATPVPTSTVIPVPAFTPVIPPTNTPVPPTPAPTTVDTSATPGTGTPAGSPAATTTAAAATTAASTPTVGATTAAPTPSPTS